MQGTAIDAVRADRAALLDLCARLSPAEWRLESGCQGWSVQDVVAHMANLFWAVVDPSRLPATEGMPTEQAQEAGVAARRDCGHAAILADYEQVSSAALDRLAEFAGHDFVVPLGDLGSYPLSVLPSAYSFDHYLHIRADLFTPRGPLDGPPPPADESRLTSVLDWIEAALPQQNQAAAEAVSLRLEITGPAARTISFGTGQPAATIASAADAFARWVSQRGGWAELGVQATGDTEALGYASKLKVF
jgi:uncharacterized protein (TIGR03083 family)